MVADTVQAYGGLDVLHNNAAALDQNRVDQDVVTMDLATWDRVMAVNLTGPMLGCRFAIPPDARSAVPARSSTPRRRRRSTAAILSPRTAPRRQASSRCTRYVATAYGERGSAAMQSHRASSSPRPRKKRSAAPWAIDSGDYSTSHLVGRLGYPRGDRGRRGIPRLRRRRVRHGGGAAGRRRLHRALADLRDGSALRELTRPGPSAAPSRIAPISVSCACGRRRRGSSAPSSSGTPRTVDTRRPHASTTRRARHR